MSSSLQLGGIGGSLREYFLGDVDTLIFTGWTLLRGKDWSLFSSEDLATIWFLMLTQTQFWSLRYVFCSPPFSLREIQVFSAGLWIRTLLLCELQGNLRKSLVKKGHKSPPSPPQEVLVLTSCASWVPKAQSAPPGCGAHFSTPARLPPTWRARAGHRSRLSFIAPWQLKSEVFNFFSYISTVGLDRTELILERSLESWVDIQSVNTPSWEKDRGIIMNWRYSEIQFSVGITPRNYVLYAYFSKLSFILQCR